MLRYNDFSVGKIKGTEQEWTCKTSNWLRLHAAPFLKIRMEAAVIRILTNLLFLICKGQNLDE